jgi:hypothetical protein
MCKSKLTIAIPWNGAGDIHQFLKNACSLAFVSEVLLAPAHDLAYRMAKAELKNFSKFCVLEPGDAGIYSAYNKLIKNCKTTHICFHGVDDFIIHNNGLDQRLDKLDTDFMLVFTAQFCTVTGQQFALYHHYENNPETVRLGRFISPATPEIIYPVAILRKINGADESYRIAGDADLYFRARAICSRLDINAVFVNMRDGGASTAAKHSRTILIENRRIARSQNQSISYVDQLKAYFFLNGRYLLYRLAGEKLSNVVTDVLRLLVGRRPRYSRR